MLKSRLELIIIIIIISSSSSSSNSSSSTYTYIHTHTIHTRVHTHIQKHSRHSTALLLLSSQVHKLQSYIRQLSSSAAKDGSAASNGGKCETAALEQLHMTDAQLAAVEAALVAALDEEGRMRQELEHERRFVQSLSDTCVQTGTDGGSKVHQWEEYAGDFCYRMGVYMEGHNREWKRSSSQVCARQLESPFLCYCTYKG